MKIIVYKSFLRLNGIAKIKNAEIKMLCFGTQIAKISNRRKYPLYGISFSEDADSNRNQGLNTVDDLISWGTNFRGFRGGSDPRISVPTN